MQCLHNPYCFEGALNPSGLEINRNLIMNLAAGTLLPLQFLPIVRKKYIKFHRYTGRLLFLMLLLGNTCLSPLMISLTSANCIKAHLELLTTPSEELLKPGSGFILSAPWYSLPCSDLGLPLGKIKLSLIGFGLSGLGDG